MGLYHEGWTLSGKPYRVPWTVDPSAMANFDPLNTEWELYNIDEDPIQSVNLADQYPDKVKELEELFWQEAKNIMSIPLAALWAECYNLSQTLKELLKSIGNSHLMFIEFPS
jgi:arylsulfatase A-like enzyme